jgi:hypothetical protein
MPELFTTMGSFSFEMGSFGFKMALLGFKMGSFGFVFGIRAVRKFSYLIDNWLVNNFSNGFVSQKSSFCC